MTTPNPNQAPAPEWPESKLAEIEKYCEKATPGPWEEGSPRVNPEALFNTSHCDGLPEKLLGHIVFDVDRRFCAKARRDLPEAVEQIRRLRAEVVELRKDRERKKWLCESGAYMAFSEDGDDCWLVWPHNRQDEEDDKQRVQKGVFSSHNAAIDAAKEPK